MKINFRLVNHLLCQPVELFSVEWNFQNFIFYPITAKCVIQSNGERNIKIIFSTGWHTSFLTSVSTDRISKCWSFGCISIFGPLTHFLKTKCVNESKKFDRKTQVVNFDFRSVDTLNGSKFRSDDTSIRLAIDPFSFRPVDTSTRWPTPVCLAFNRIQPFPVLSQIFNFGLVEYFFLFNG